MSFPSLKVPQAVDSLEKNLEHMILSGIVRPDTTLPSERKFAEQIGVSRTTLRETFSRLRAKGLLRMTQQGHQISDVLNMLLSQSLRQFSEDNGAELFLLWQDVSRFSIAGAADKANSQDKEAISRAGEDFIMALVWEDREKLCAAFYDYWMSIAEASYNFFLMQLMHTLLKGFRPFFSRCFLCLLENEAYGDRATISMQSLQHSWGQSTSDVESFLSLVANIAAQEKLPLQFTSYDEEKVTLPLEIASRRVLELAKSGSVPIGEELPSVKELAQRFELSANAIKLAFQQLEALGVLEIGKLGVARLMSIKPKDPLQSLIDAILRQSFAVEAIFELRMMIECRATEEASEKMTDEDRSNLDELIIEMDASVRSSQSNFSKLDFRFHQMIAEGTKNTSLRTLQRSFGQIVERVTEQWLLTHAFYEGDNFEIQQQHREIATAIIRGNSKKAVTAMREHLEYVVISLKAYEQKSTYAAISRIRSQVR